MADRSGARVDDGRSVRRARRRWPIGPARARRRWSIRPGSRQTLADLPPLRQRVGSADRPPSRPLRRHWSICLGTGPVLAVARPICPAREATVDTAAQTLVDPPTRHADEMSADRPPSRGNRGRSTTVTRKSGQIDHRSRGNRGRSATVNAKAPAAATPRRPHEPLAGRRAVPARRTPRYGERRRIATGQVDQRTGEHRPDGGQQVPAEQRHPGRRRRLLGRRAQCREDHHGQCELPADAEPEHRRPDPGGRVGGERDERERHPGQRHRRGDPRPRVAEPVGQQRHAERRHELGRAEQTEQQPGLGADEPSAVYRAASQASDA